MNKTIFGLIKPFISKAIGELKLEIAVKVDQNTQFAQLCSVKAFVTKVPFVLETLNRKLHGDSVQIAIKHLLLLFLTLNGLLTLLW